MSCGETWLFFVLRYMVLVLVLGSLRVTRILTRAPFVATYRQIYVEGFLFWFR